MTAEPPATAPAAPKPNSSGCIFLLVAVAALVIGGFAWNAITGTSGSHSRTVSRSSYAGAWPLTLDSVKIGCDGSNPWVLVGDTFYALNGAGKMAGYKDIDPIWAYDPATSGLKLDISGLRAQAEKLC